MIPGPIVEDKVIFLKYVPLTELGFDFSTPFIVENGGDTTFTLIVWFNESVQDGTPIQFEIPSSHSFVSNNTGSAIINTLDAAVKIFPFSHKIQICFLH